MRPSILQSVNIHPFLSKLGPARKTVFFRKRQVIFSVGDASDSVFFVEGGSAKLTVTSVDGREALVTTLEEGDLLGSRFLIQTDCHVRTVRLLLPTFASRELNVR